LYDADDDDDRSDIVGWHYISKHAE